MEVLHVFNNPCLLSMLWFTGLHGSLVLHSDSCGDSWVQGQDDSAFEYNGWHSYVVSIVHYFTFQNPFRAVF